MHYHYAIHTQTPRNIEFKSLPQESRFLMALRENHSRGPPQNYDKVTDEYSFFSLLNT
jgi:hypothetical protein